MKRIVKIYSSMKTAFIFDILVAPGDSVEMGQYLMKVGEMRYRPDRIIDSKYVGTVVEVLAKPGESINRETVIMLLEVEESENRHIPVFEAPVVSPAFEVSVTGIYNKSQTDFELSIVSKTDLSQNVKVGLANLIDIDGQVKIQKGWGAGVNGGKGFALLPKTFCKLNLIFAKVYSGKHGDRLVVVIDGEKGEPSHCLTFRLSSMNAPYPEFVLISSEERQSSNAPSSGKVVGVRAEKRIEVLENQMVEALAALDVLQGQIAELQKSRQSHSIQSFDEVCAWLVMQRKVNVQELRTRLLPLNILVGAFVSELNELAISKSDDIALKDMNDEIFVDREMLAGLLSSVDMNALRMRISS